jgi:hypothetical protein
MNGEAFCMKHGTKVFLPPFEEVKAEITGGKLVSGFFPGVELAKRHRRARSRLRTTALETMA